MVDHVVHDHEVKFGLVGHHEILQGACLLFNIQTRVKGVLDLSKVGNKTFGRSVELGLQEDGLFGPCDRSVKRQETDAPANVENRFPPCIDSLENIIQIKFQVAP